MKNFALLIGVTLFLSACEAQQPMMKVFMKSKPIEFCNNRPVARKIDLRDNSVSTGTGDMVVCENGTCSTLRIGECHIWAPVESEDWQLMPVVTFDSRMANDPDFKKSVTHVEYQ